MFKRKVVEQRQTPILCPVHFPASPTVFEKIKQIGADAPEVFAMHFLYTLHHIDGHRACLILEYFFSDFDIENGGNTFLRNISKLMLDYTASHPRRQHPFAI
jgi:hypothetical protein